MKRRLTLLSLAMAGALSTLSTAVQAQADYPSKPIKLIVDGPAGGINDIWARRYTNVMGPAMKQTFIIDNRTGASGSLATATRALLAIICLVVLIVLVHMRSNTQLTNDVCMIPVVDVIVLIAYYQIQSR